MGASRPLKGPREALHAPAVGTCFVTSFQANEARLPPGLVRFAWGWVGGTGLFPGRVLQAKMRRKLWGQRLSAKPQNLGQSLEQILPLSEAPSPADPFISDFWPPALRGRVFLLF